MWFTSNHFFLLLYFAWKVSQLDLASDLTANAGCRSCWLLICCCCCYCCNGTYMCHLMIEYYSWWKDSAQNSFTNQVKQSYSYFWCIYLLAKSYETVIQWDIWCAMCVCMAMFMNAFFHWRMILLTCVYVRMIVFVSVMNL